MAAAMAAGAVGIGQEHFKLSGVIAFGERADLAGRVSITPNGHVLNLRTGLKGYSDVTVKGSGTLLSSPYTMGIPRGRWKVEPGVDALLHVSQISHEHVDKPSDVLRVGQEIEAKIVEQIDKIDLAASDDEDEEAAEAAAEAMETGEEPPSAEAAPAGGEDISGDDDFEEFDPTE